MKLWHSAAAAAALACLSASAMAATVDYSCDGGRQVSVNYKFNSAGVPTSAQATIQGRRQVMAYDQGRSDSVETSFKNRAGYRLSGSQMDSRNYRQSSIMITAPNDEILFKNCSPNAGGRAAAPAPAAAQDTGSVAYACQGGKHLSVAYQFNSAGIPVNATAKLQGKHRTLNYDQNNSSDVETIFSSQGYRLGTDGMTSSNYRSLDVMVTAPNGNLLFKSCSPVN